MLKILPYFANHVSVHPPLSQMRMGATLLTMRTGFMGRRIPQRETKGQGLPPVSLPVICHS